MKLFIVDDLVFMCKQLGELFEQVGGFVVVFVCNGCEVVSMNLEFEFDVVIFDINMFEFDGFLVLVEMML